MLPQVVVQPAISSIYQCRDTFTSGDFPFLSRDTEAGWQTRPIAKFRLSISLSSFYATENAVRPTRLRVRIHGIFWASLLQLILPGILRHGVVLLFNDRARRGWAMRYLSLAFGPVRHSIQSRAHG